MQRIGDSNSDPHPGLGLGAVHVKQEPDMEPQDYSYTRFFPGVRIKQEVEHLDTDNDQYTSYFHGDNRQLNNNPFEYQITTPNDDKTDVQLALPVGTERTQSGDYNPDLTKPAHDKEVSVMEVHQDFRYGRLPTHNVWIKQEPEPVDTNRDTSSHLGVNPISDNMSIKDEIGTLITKDPTNQHPTNPSDTTSKCTPRVRPNPCVLLVRLPAKPTRKRNTKTTFTCKVCNYTCYSRSHLIGHEKIHSGIKPFICKHCSYATYQHSNLRTHEIIHTGKRPFACQTCSFTCNSRSGLNSHEKIHSGLKPFVCAYCSYATNQRSYLRKHELVHSREKLFACNICSFTSNWPSNLRAHEIIHTGKKPFACEICNFKCNSLSGLFSHKKKHSGVKPYNCKLCSFATRQSSNLKKHEMIHFREQPFTCKICSYETYQNSDLKEHEKIHSEN